MHQNLADAVKITRLENAVAAGSADENSAVIDMQDFEGVMFLTLFGTITAGAATSVRIQQGTDATVTDAADLAGTSITVADDDDNQIVVHDIFRPIERYLRVQVKRATQNAVIDGVVAIQYGARKTPTTNDSTTVVGRETHISPAEGTA